MTRDDINEIALSITDELVQEGIVIDAQKAETEFEEEQEDIVYNIIVVKLCKVMGIDYDD